MSLFQAVRERFAECARLPEIHGERCVHARIEVASCRACVDACPQGAWRLDDTGLDLDTAACDGCGVCVPACPEEVLAHAYAPVLGRLGKHLVGMAACERSGVEEGAAGRLPCLHALGGKVLLDLYRQGMRGLFLADGDCADCPRRAGESLQRRVEDLNNALQQRACAPIVARRLSSAAWLRQFQGMGKPQAAEVRLNRRSFFWRGLRRLGDAALRGGGPADNALPLPVGALLPDPPGPLPRVPHIDAARCDGCDACVRLCPHRAILLETAEGTPAYRIEARQCTGCGICVDVCQPRAIALLTWAPPAQTRIALASARCRRCGAPFHRPATPARPNLCHVCAQARNPSPYR